MAGAVGLSIVTKSPTAASTVFGLYQKGNIYQEAREKGLTPKKAGELSTVAGVIEGGLEYVGLDFMLSKFGGSIKSTLIRAGSEGVQEWLQQFGENIVTQAGGVREFTGMDSLLEGTGRSALIGVMLGLPVGVSISIAERGGIIKELKDRGLNDKQAKQMANQIVLKQREEAENIVDNELKEQLPEAEIEKAPKVSPVEPEAPKKADKEAIVEPIEEQAKKFKTADEFLSADHTVPIDTVTTPVTREEIIKVAGKIESRHPDEPVAVFINAEGKLGIKDGNNRYYQRLDAGEKTIKIYFPADKQNDKRVTEIFDKAQKKVTEKVDLSKEEPLTEEAKKYKTVEEFSKNVYEGNIPVKEELKFNLRRYEERMGAKDIFPGATIPGAGKKLAEYTINWDEKLKVYTVMVDGTLAAETPTLKEAVDRSVEFHGRPFVSRTGYKEPTAEEQIKKQLTDIYNKAQEKPKEPVKKEEPKPPSPAAGATAPAKVTEAKGYGTIESSERAAERAKQGKIAKSDYSKVDEALPKNAGIIDEVLKITSPAERKGALIGKKILRKNIADLAHKDVVASEALKKAHRAFNWMNKEDTLTFIDNMENGKPQKTEKLEKVAKTLRDLLDGRRADVQGLGKGHLESFIENYFPHIWKDPAKAKNVIASIMGKKRLEGTKSFLKKRVIVSVKEGIEKGLEPVSDNPVDIALLKLHEMDRYIMSQNIIQDLKSRGLIKFVYSRGGQVPEGYAKVNDNAFTVYMPPEITKKDYFDQNMVDQLMDISRALGIDTKRFVSIGGKRTGFAQWFPGKEGGERIRTKFASPESVLAHEIGHVLGVRYNLFDLLGRRNDGEWRTRKFGKNVGKKYFVPSEDAIAHRKKIDQQWRDLADARAKGLDPKKFPGYFKYVRNAREKEAVMLEALMHAPEEFKSVAPDLYKMFTTFLNNNAELRPILDIRPSLVLGANEAKIKIPGFTTLGSYYVSEPTARLLNNYLSPGLRNSENKIIGTGYNLLRGAGNVLNQAQLALSLFHGLNVTSDMAASTFGLGIRKLNTRGQRIQGLTDIASTAIAPVINVWNGARIRKAYTQQVDQITNPKTRQMVEAVIAAGGRDRMDTFYYNNQMKALEKTFSDIVRGDAFTKVKSTLKLPFNLFGATLEGLAKPLMEWYVPTGKIGLFAKLAQHELERAETEQIDQDQLWERLTQSWDSVDNRMGQLIYDNLFWEKTIKDTLMLAIRSVGWNLGSWREFGGAVVDVATTQERIKRGDIWLSQKMAYTIGAVTIYSILGAVITYLLTGEPPEEPKDYLFPRTGKKNTDGSDERLSLPTYAKDWYAWSHQPLKTATHKIHPLWGLLGDLSTNKDFFNVEIRHTEDPLLAQAGQVAKHIGESFKSISLRNYEKMERVSPNRASNPWISITGISPAPSYITKSPAQKLMTRLIVERIPPKSKTQAEFERSTYRRTLKNRLRKGERIDREEAISRLGQTSYKTLLKEAKRTPFADSFNRLSIKDALNVYAIATREEKAQVKRILESKFNRARSFTKTPEVRKYYEELTGKKRFIRR